MSFQSPEEPSPNPVRMQWDLRGTPHPHNVDLRDVARWSMAAWVAALALFAHAFVCEGVTPRVERWAIVQVVFLALWGILFLRRVP